KIVGQLLTAIEQRASFSSEDWLIVIVGDHGGYGKSHGMWGGHATTVPMLICGKQVQNGRIPGISYNFDAAATALQHFNLYSEKLNLDGRPRCNIIAKENKLSLKDGLEAYFNFSEKQPENLLENKISAKIYGAKTSSGSGPGAFAGGFLRIDGSEDNPGGMILQGSEQFAEPDKPALTFCLWVRVAANPPGGDPVIIGNKDWRDGKKPGFILTSARKMESASLPGVCLNYARSGEIPRIDMGPFDVEYDSWSFYAVTFSDEGVAYMYQGRDDGHLYWLCDRAEDAVLHSGMPWHLGQDGSGKYKFPFRGDIDDLALWSRALSSKEIRAVYEAGRKGMELADLLQ
ncbi:MAG: hypothetical protein GX901_10845, partial [Lentisphaerae bacterium]|nr:hypothetical protein [Lentisphaerota bacterium]